MNALTADQLIAESTALRAKFSQAVDAFMEGIDALEGAIDERRTWTEPPDA